MSSIREKFAPWFEDTPLARETELSGTVTVGGIQLPTTGARSR